MELKSHSGYNPLHAKLPKSQHQSIQIHHFYPFLLLILPTPRSLLPRGDPASLLVLGRPQQGPGQAGSALHSSFVRGRRVVSGGLPLTCNLRRLREVDLRPEGTWRRRGKVAGSGKNSKIFGISLDMVETMGYAAYVFMPGNRVF